MVQQARKCVNCGGAHIVLNGKKATNQQRYKCEYCGVPRILNALRKRAQLDPSMVILTYEQL